MTPSPPLVLDAADALDAAVDAVLDRLEGPLRIAAPLGLGKPHRLLNTLYARVAADPSRPLSLYTALSLDPPVAKGDGLEARFLGPFVERHFGADYPRLAYVQDLKRGAVPAHVVIEEFYLQSGALLGSAQAQRHYASLNYTHVARAIAERGVNAIVQKVAEDASGRLSISSNTDLTFDAIDALRERGLPRPLMVAEVDPQLPWLANGADVPPDFFDIVVRPPPPYPPLFGLPRQPVGDAEYAIGLYASTLVRDGGTLQIGIGALADALSHALVLRHTDNARYRRVLDALDPALATHPAVLESGGIGPFEQGLYGCSEMINEGFRRLVEARVIRRKVIDDLPLMQRLHDGTADAGDLSRLEREGDFLHGAFYLGSPEFYDWLRTLPEDVRPHIGMRRVSEVNELYGGREALERLQRRHARFFNTCMMATALGAAVSDTLEDGRVVSGVGGQYNFVAMAHALRESRSVLMLRASRVERGRPVSNLRWSYGQATIPRHLRDVYITEYGIADVRGATDEDCILRMAAIADARFDSELLETARRAGKVAPDARLPDTCARNTAAHLRAALAPFRADGTLPDYPLGSDFTDVEERLVRAFGWLRDHGATLSGRLRLLLGALGARTDDAEALERMGLSTPHGLQQHLLARLLALGLSRTPR